MKNDKTNGNAELLKKYLNNYSKMETKYFIRFLALCYLDNFAFYDLIGSFNALVRESDNSIPDIDMDDNFYKLQEINPYYFLDRLTQEVIVTTIMQYIEDCDIEHILCAVKALTCAH
jgi:hypothetical protein